MNINRPRVYIAGPLNPHNGGGAIEYLRNCSRMIDAARDLIKAGYAPFCPAVDAAFFLGGTDDETPTAEEIKSYSASWIRGCDAMLVMPGWKQSKGTLAEIDIAHDLKIGAFENMGDVLVYLKSKAND